MSVALNHGCRVGRVGYFIWCESLLSKIIKTQVFSLIDTISHEESMRINVFHICQRSSANIPSEISRLSNSRLSIHQWKFFIFPKNTPLIFPVWWSAPIVFLISFACMVFAIFKYRLTILHIRSYPLAMSALAVKILYPKISIVFDTRSPFPEENVTMGRWSRESLTFLMWKKVEKWAFSSLDSIIFTSREQVRTHDFNLKNSKFKVIRNNSANSTFYRLRADFINKSKIASLPECFVYAYVGSADRSGWNRPGPYIEFIKILMSLPGRSMVVFITMSGAIFKAELDAAGISEEFYKIYSCDPEFVAEYLSECHAGLNFMTAMDTRMSVKTADYYGNGLPVICNSNVRGCVELIEGSQAGIVLKEGDEARQLMCLRENYSEYQARASSMSELFSVECIARNYVDVYKSFEINASP